MSESPTEIPEYQQGLDMDEEASSAYEKREITASWDVPTKRQVYKVEFEHGTASGKRVLWVNGKVIIIFFPFSFISFLKSLVVYAANKNRSG